jgi:hypothetical protein
MTEQIAPPTPPTAKYTLTDYIFQFVTVTAGVLIALLLNGLVEWNDNRELVAQARATISRELSDNKADLERVLKGVDQRHTDLDHALQLANDLLAKGITDVRSLNLGFSLATLSQTSWQSAERTGALGHMDYTEVRRYAGPYEFQDLFVQQQRKSLDLISAASALLTPAFDPAKPNLQDIGEFRRHVLQLQAALGVEKQLGEALLKAYAEALRAE